MKNGIKKSILVAAALVSAFWAHAQQPGVPPPPAPLNEAGPRPAPLAPERRIAPLTQLCAVSGKIIEYTANDRYEYDGFTLQTPDKTLTVKFPAQLGAQLMKAAPKGSSVTINGAAEEGPEGSVFRFYSMKNGNNVIIDTPPAPDQQPPVEQIKDFTGTISELNHDQRGMINGIILNGKTLVNLPPPAVEQLSAYLKTGTRVSGTGIQRATPAGVIIAGNMNLTDARTLSIGGQTYLLR